MLRGLLTLLYFLEIIGFFVLGFLAIVRQRSGVNKAFFHFAAALGTWQLLQALSIVTAEQRQLSIGLLLSSVFMSAIMVIFLFNFISMYTKKTRKNWLFLPAVFIGSLAFFSENLRQLPITIDGIGIPKVDFFYGVVLAFAGLFLILSVVKLINFYRGTKSQKEREQTKTILACVAIAGSITMLSSFYTSDFSDTFLAQQIIPLTCLFMLGGFAYAIAYRDLFDIHIFALRAAAYATSYLMLAILIAVPIVYIISQLLSLDLSLLSVLGYSFGMAILAYGLQLLRAQFDKLTFKFFFRRIYDTQSLLDEHNNVLVVNSELQALLNNSREVIMHHIQPQFCGFWLFPTEHVPERFVGITPPTKSLEEIKRLTSDSGLNSQQVVVVDDMEDKTGSVKELLSSVGISAIILLSAGRDNKIGYLILGPRKSGDLYGKRDTKVLQIIANELVVAIQNALRFEEIAHFNKTLQKEIHDATDELRTKNAQLRHLDVTKDEFLSIASHQLRTPLTSVKGYISMILEGDVGKITETQRHLLSEAFASSERMVHLIHDFLNVSRLQTGKFVIEQHPYDLVKLLKEEVESLRRTAEARRIKLKFDTKLKDLVLNIDENKIRQVIMNFVDNALYYSHEGTTVVIDLKVTESAVEARVKDAGIGVPKAEQAQLFGKFYRATNARKQRPDGTGVGLFLAKKVIVGHGGDMLFESTEGKGSTFGFTLPLAKLKVEPVLENSVEQLVK